MFVDLAGLIFIIFPVITITAIVIVVATRKKKTLINKDLTKIALYIIITILSIASIVSLWIFFPEFMLAKSKISFITTASLVIIIFVSILIKKIYKKPPHD